MKAVRLFRIALWAMIALLGVAAVSLWALYDQRSDRSAEAPYGTPFALVDQNDRPVTEAAFRGHPTAVFFGFTHCPDVCPTTLAELAQRQNALRAAGKTLQVAFVTVDPARDTPAMLKTYVGALSPDIMALTGKPADVEAMLKGWGVYFKRIGDGEDYSMDHTASTFLLDAKGRLVGTLAYGEDAKAADAKIDRLLSL